MKTITRAAISGLISAVILTGCGGGGGSKTVSRSASKVLVFGNMTSTAMLATVKTTFSLPTGPEGVMVNYSSAPGASAGNCIHELYVPTAIQNGLPVACILRKSVIQPTGTTLLDEADFIGSSYDIASATLTINMSNNGRKSIRSSLINGAGKGTEIATINLKLATPGVIPTGIRLQDTTAEIGQYMPGSPTPVSILPDSRINFITTYH